MSFEVTNETLSNLAYLRSKAVSANVEFNPHRMMEETVEENVHEWDDLEWVNDTQRDLALSTNTAVFVTVSPTPDWRKQFTIGGAALDVVVTAAVKRLARELEGSADGL